MIDRARQVGCTKLIVTGSSFRSSRDALSIAKEYREMLLFIHLRFGICSEYTTKDSLAAHTVYTTAGIHPCSSSIFDAAHPHSHQDDPEESAEHTPACGPDPTKPIPNGQAIDQAKTDSIIADLRTLVDNNRTAGLIALGEFGLDYDRLHYCSRDLQLHSFRAQLTLAAQLTPQLPLFLHSRAAHGEFVACLKEAFGEQLERLEKGGVVHSFTGTAEEMIELMDLGLYIGLNGCSFKTAENCEVVKAVRLDRLMVETDGPWCEVRPTHEGWKYLVEMEKKEREQAEAEAVAAAAAAAAAASPPKAEAQAQSSIEPAPENGAAKNGSTDVSQRPRPPRQKKQPQQSSKKPQKKESEVMERFKVVKKEKWVEGAMVKGRNEPCTIERVAKVVASIMGVSLEEVCEAAWQNTVKVFSLNEKA